MAQVGAEGLLAFGTRQGFGSSTVPPEQELLLSWRCSLWALLC